MTFNAFASAIVNRLIMVALPEKLRLGASASWSRFQGRVEPEILLVPKLMGLENCHVALDVGANDGQFAYLLSRVFSHVYAFEANPELVARLQRSRPENMSITQCAVSDTDGAEVVLNVPVVGGVRLNGWASLGTIDIPGAIDFVKHMAKTIRLDSQVFESVSLIKIDVEGHELAVLKGAIGTIKKHLPWLVIEVWDEHRAVICDLLLPLGYHAATLKQMTGIDGSPQNLIFMPPQTQLKV
jgi:FkbM family methyltransferase